VIPRAHITAWRKRAPWPDDDLVEQDLVLSRALVEMFSHPVAAAALAFRGGTALHKLIFEAPLRYSEDIDLVQLPAGPIREVMQAIHDRLDGWLGKPSTSQGATGVKMIYAFDSESEPRGRRKLKVEIHTREHFTVLGLEGAPFAVSNPWFTGAVRIPIYRPEELIGTKLRALYQRKKGRDLFDLAQSVTT
jgi:predicted nucleotidyltransferase component of viral defense system